MTPAQVEEIKAKLQNNCDKSKLAKEYGISRPTLYKIIKGL